MFKKTLNSFSILSMLILWIIIFLPQYSWAGAVGSFTFIHGRVDILRVGADRAIPVVLGEEVSIGDIVRTKSKARTQITFIDDSVINIAEKSRVEIKEFFFEPEKERRSSVLRVFRGKLRAIVSKVFLGDGSRFEVETPTAVAGVRGTDFLSIVRVQATDVIVLKGLVAVRNLLPEIAGEVVLGSNQASRIAMDHPPSPPRPVRPEEVAPLVRDTAPEEPEEEETPAGEGEEAPVEEEAAAPAEEEASAPEPIIIPEPLPTLQPPGPTILQPTETTTPISIEIIIP